MLVNRKTAAVECKLKNNTVTFTSSLLNIKTTIHNSVTKLTLTLHILWPNSEMNSRLKTVFNSTVQQLKQQNPLQCTYTCTVYTDFVDFPVTVSVNVRRMFGGRTSSFNTFDSVANGNPLSSISSSSCHNHTILQEMSVRSTTSFTLLISYFR